MGRSKSYKNEEIIYLIEAWGAFKLSKNQGLCNREMFTIISNNFVARGFVQIVTSGLE